MDAIHAGAHQRHSLTLFAIPNAFEGHTGVIQTNAIQSWARLDGCEVVLFGEEAGLAEAAARLRVRRVPDLARNDRGTPMVSDAFRWIQGVATAPAVAYVNSDIMFTSDIVAAAEFLAQSGLREWLVVGQRRDLDVSELLPFSEGWEARLRADVSARAQPHGVSGIDYFLFPRGWSVEFPPLAVGRPGWDNWLIYRARALGIPVIDASASVLCIHQNHPSRYRSFELEARRNSRAAGGYYNMATLRDADWRLETLPDGTGFRLVRRPLGKIMFSPPVRGLLAVRRYAAEKLAGRGA